MSGVAADICRDLAAFASSVAGEGKVHFVAHSLGGAIVYRTLAEGGADRFCGNAVLLGSPLNGSKAASGAARWPMLRPLLGPHVLNELAVVKPRHWTGSNAFGSIAGTLRMGTGQFFAHFDEDNDGTVGVSETRIPGLADHLLLPHSHFGMLYARDVAGYVAHFLRNGRFLAAATQAPGGGGLG